MRFLHPAISVALAASLGSLVVVACGGSEFTQATPTGSSGAAGDSAGGSNGTGGTVTAGTSATGGTAGAAAGTGGNAGGTGGSAGTTGGSGGTAGGGAGGKGGSSGASGAGGSGIGGGAAMCTGPMDCPAPSSFCQSAVCLGGLCGLVAANADVKLPDAQQTKGDCQAIACSSNGGTKIVPDDVDVPAQGSNACVIPACASGKSMPKNATPGTPCNGGMGTCNDMGACGSCTAGTKTCTGAHTFATCTSAGMPGANQTCPGTASICTGDGSCVQCMVASDCPMAANECATPTCDMGMCGTTPKMANSPTTAQTGGDCKINVCDGKGGITTQVDVTDKPTGMAPVCTVQACSAMGMPFPPASAGVSCGARQTCDGMGTCGCAPGTVSVLASGTGIPGGCIAFGGAYQQRAMVQSPACDGASGSLSCATSNPFTGTCGCPKGLTAINMMLLGPPAGAPQTTVCDLTTFCVSPTFDPMYSELGGMYLKDASLCRVPNPEASGCACPTGTQDIIVPVRVPGTTPKDAELHYCLGGASIAGQTFYGLSEALTGGYVNPADTNTSCVAPNAEPGSGGCGCPSAAMNEPLEASTVGCLPATCAINKGPAPSSLGVCWAPLVRGLTRTTRACSLSALLRSRRLLCRPGRRRAVSWLGWWRRWSRC